MHGKVLKGLRGQPGTRGSRRVQTKNMQTAVAAVLLALALAPASAFGALLPPSSPYALQSLSLSSPCPALRLNVSRVALASVAVEID